MVTASSFVLRILIQENGFYVLDGTLMLTHLHNFTLIALTANRFLEANVNAFSN